MTMKRKPRELLSEAIEASGLSNRKFATCVLVVDESSVRRWLGGGTMPTVVLEFLLRYLEVAHAQHQRRLLASAAKLLAEAWE